MPNHQALCIGIDSYPLSNTLPGAVRSAQGLAKLLLARGFHVATLLNEQATKSAIAAAIQRAYKVVTGMGDILCLAYIGHGARINLNGTVTDCIVPQDAILPSGVAVPANLITAAQWHAMLAVRPAHAHVLTLPDCCYGGGELARMKLYPSAVPHVAHGIPWFVDAVTPFGDVEVIGQSETSLLPNASSSNLLGFAPCTNDQLSVEQQEGGLWYSIFTYYLLKAMQNPSLANANYTQIFTAVKAECMAAYPQATPMMVGDMALAGKKFLT
jgi:hypothetical protein